MRQTDSEYLRQTAGALDNLAQEIESLVLQAERLLKADKVTAEVWEQARPQWFASIVSSVHSHSEWMGGPKVKMTTSIDRLREQAEELEYMENKGILEQTVQVGY